MAEQHFELTIKGNLDDAVLDALFTAGCDDATVSNKGDLIFAEFDREAPNMLAAVISAIDQVESVDGLEVLHVDPDELVWASEIAQRIGRTRQSVDQLIKGQRGPGGFPSPRGPRHPQSTVAVVRGRRLVRHLRGPGAGDRAAARARRHQRRPPGPPQPPRQPRCHPAA